MSGGDGAGDAGMVVEDARDPAGVVRVRELQHRFASAAAAALSIRVGGDAAARPLHTRAGGKAWTRMFAAGTHRCYHAARSRIAS